MVKKLFFVVLLCCCNAAHSSKPSAFGLGWQWQMQCTWDIEGDAADDGECYTFIMAFYLGALSVLGPQTVLESECNVHVEEYFGNDLAESFVDYVETNPEVRDQYIEDILIKFWGLDSCGLRGT